MAGQPRCCYVFVEDVPGERGESIDIRVVGGELFALVHRPLLADPDHMFRLLSLAITRHVQRSWEYVGSDLMTA